MSIAVGGWARRRLAGAVRPSRQVRPPSTAGDRPAVSTTSAGSAAEAGRWLWAVHSLRHVFATWTLHEARIPIEDLSRLMGHSSTRVAQDIYIHARDNMFGRFFRAAHYRDDEPEES